MSLEPITPAELAERTTQLRQWLQEEARLLVHDDVSEDERARMVERAETACLLEAQLAHL